MRFSHFYFMFPLTVHRYVIASFDMQKNGLHHSVLRAIIHWFLDRSDNGEWCALSTYKISLKLTIISQEAHFLVIQWSGRGFVGLVFHATAIIASGWIADSVVSLSAHVQNNRLLCASQSVIGSRGKNHDIVVTNKPVWGSWRDR